jgi:hypothetical protein
MRSISGAFTAVLYIAAACSEPISRAVKAPKVDLRYAVYEGNYDAKNNINVFKG